MAVSPNDNASNPVVITRAGAVRGKTSVGIHAFKGVPFAEPPFGSNHLNPPQPRKPWEGVRDALAFGPKSPQVPSPPRVVEIFAEIVGPGKDCLTLNVWTPSLDGTAPGHPVMVWFSGGMFEFHGTGGSAYYDGSKFARDGVVCVTINYRVGAEGFLHLGDGTTNLGLLDQIAGLHWVRDNIGAFGGDPNNVTIFGESAGAMSVATLLAVPRAKGLFRRAIVQSGSSPKVNSATTAEKIGRRLAEMLGVETTREAIAATPTERIFEAQAKLREDFQAPQPDQAFWGEVLLNNLPWSPTVDGEILPQDPLEAVRKGVAADIDLLVGSNTEETRLFLVPDGSIDSITEDALEKLAGAYGLSPEGLDAYRAWLPDANAGELFSTVQTDGYWRVPAVRFADGHAVSANHDAATYMYELAWPSPQVDGRLGAAHGLDVPFVFDTLGRGTEPLLGPDPPQTLADRMHRAWVAFATTGDPGWTKYEVGRRATMRFDEVSQVVDNPLKRQLEVWKSLP